MAIVLKKVTPTFNGILTTSDVYTIEDCTYNGIVDSEFVGKVKQIQKAIAEEIGMSSNGVECMLSKLRKTGIIKDNRIS